MTSARPPLYLIDGSGYIFRAFYAIRPLSTRSGVPTNAVLGFARMLLKLLRERQPHLLGIAFDTVRKNFRHEIYADYKANREAPPEDLAPQFELIHELVRAMDIPVLMLDGFEADDVLATLSLQAVRRGHPVTVVSADKDLMQLVDGNIAMFDPMKDRLFDRDAVIERFGVPPKSLADVLALAGDSSDNVPGVPRVGPKSAAKLVQEFGDVEAVIAGLKKRQKRKAFEEAVLQHAEQARISKRLVLLQTEAPIELDTDKLVYRAPNLDKLGPFLRHIEAYSLLRDFGLAPEDDDAAGAKTIKPAREPEPAAAAETTAAAPFVAAIDRGTYQTIVDVEALKAVCKQIDTVGQVSVDLETTSLEPARADIVGVALCVRGVPPAYVPLRHHYLGVPKQLDVEVALDVLRPMLEDAEVRKIGQHIKYDAVVLSRAGIKLRGISEDSMLAAYVLDPARASYSLDSLAREFLGHHNMSYNDVTGTGKARKSFTEVPVDVATRYAAEDADVALRLCELLVPKVKSAGLDTVYRDIEVPLCAVLAEMEADGVLIDSGTMTGLGKEFTKRLVELENEAFKLIGNPINLGSPKQLAYLFFEKLGYPVIKKTKTGYSTDQEVLETLAKTFELPRVILMHRLLSKLKSTYVDALPKIVNPHTGRVHTSFNQTGTATGRLSSSDPNLQNIPIRSDDGRRIRAAFVAPEGHVIVSADYSQIELRVMAHLSQDPAFLQAFGDGEDIHARTANEILGHLPASDKEKRRRAKAINFGILYGLSEFGLSRQLSIPRAEAHEYIKLYFSRYPRIRHFLDSNIERGRSRGYVATITGRRRYLPNLRSKNTNVRNGAERIAMNTPIQGSAADLIKLAMLAVHKALRDEGLRARMLLQVHDELVIEAPEAEVQAVSDLLRKQMSGVMQLDVPLEVDVGHGKTWADAH